MTSTHLKPFFPYYGSKWRAAPRYPDPVFDIVEPFAGSAGYSTFHAPRYTTLVDLDRNITDTWDYLLTAEPDEILDLPDLASPGDSLDNHPNLSRGAQCLIGFWLNRGSASPKRTRTTYSARTDQAQLTWGPRAKARIVTQLPFIRDWTVVNSDYRVLGSSSPRTWFIDPPYQDKGRYYRKSEVDYTALAEWAQGRDGQVIVCEGAGADWLPFRPFGDFKTTHGSAPELIWTK